MILEAGPVPSAALLALNQADADRLSPLTAERLTALIGRAFMACRIGEADALLIAFDQDADYDSPNFLWFRARCRRFVYIDRVVVDPACRGRGLARHLYAALFARAAEAGHDRVVCEVNQVPPNPGSDAFHAALGFAPVGTAAIATATGNGKIVRYLSRTIESGTIESRTIDAPPYSAARPSDWRS